MAIGGRNLAWVHRHDKILAAPVVVEIEELSYRVGDNGKCELSNKIS